MQRNRRWTRSLSALGGILRTRLGLFSGVTGLCLLAGLAYGLWAPETYRATATLFVDAGSFTQGGAPQAAPGLGAGLGLDLLRSERVAQRVILDQHLAEEAGLRGHYLEGIESGRPPLEALAQFLARQVEAVAGGDGGVVRLSVTLQDPALAARVANGYAQSWREVEQELRASAVRSGIERAHQDLVALRARLGAALARRGDRGPESGAVAYADQQFAQLSKLATRSFGESADGQAPAEAGVHGIALSPVPSEPESLQAQAGDAGPLRSAADTRGSTAGRGVSSADDQIRLAQQSLERAEDRLAQLSAEEVGAAVPIYVLHEAAVPTSSIKPPLAVCALIGLAAGLLLALVSCAIAEVADRRVRHASDVAQKLGMVVLGDLPAVVPSPSLPKLNLRPARIADSR